MRFGAFREYRKIAGTIEEVTDYLRSELSRTIKDLTVGLTRLSFSDNFDSFEVTVTIPASTEVAIQNRLRTGEIPTKRIMVKGGANSHLIVDGDLSWTQDYVYLKNNHSGELTVTVIFLR